MKLHNIKQLLQENYDEDDWSDEEDEYDEQFEEDRMAEEEALADWESQKSEAIQNAIWSDDASEHILDAFRDLLEVIGDNGLSAEEFDEWFEEEREKYAHVFIQD